MEASLERMEKLFVEKLPSMSLDDKLMEISEEKDFLKSVEVDVKDAKRRVNLARGPKAKKKADVKEESSDSEKSAEG